MYQRSVSLDALGEHGEVAELLPDAVADDDVSDRDLPRPTVELAALGRRCYLLNSVVPFLSRAGQSPPLRV